CALYYGYEAWFAYW
nr:immunoglobulin heavy chain junction region [Mus musculus]MBK4185896.1 immunoglobulin heavy chain junction region [Mus musculus]MBK4185897.1 immunoglobulin heavy chain junction region [Mus musculus]MBK4196853.1 immunoglobulin heavy chain junction region [Mus musculus]MBK4196854.1 immunoglobulin heavy chain junction region [Mus musculus]